MAAPERPSYTEEEIQAVINYIYLHAGPDVEGHTTLFSGMIIRHCHLKSLFHLTDIVHQAREQGVPICSGNRGYWIGTPDECDLVGIQLIGRAKHMAEAGRALLNTAGRTRKEEKGPRQLLNSLGEQL